nr:hypothetical protein RKHAN_02509 [Rhizobium sp. Khangiran2]
MSDAIPKGWHALVRDLTETVFRDYPGVTDMTMTADRGWLHVRYDESRLDPATRLRLGRMVQGFVTQSLSTCMCCGSGHGRDRADRRVVACDSCDKEAW